MGGDGGEEGVEGGVQFIVVVETRAEVERAQGVDAGDSGIIAVAAGGGLGRADHGEARVAGGKGVAGDEAGLTDDLIVVTLAMWILGKFIPQAVKDKAALENAAKDAQVVAK